MVQGSAGTAGRTTLAPPKYIEQLGLRLGDSGPVSYLALMSASGRMK